MPSMAHTIKHIPNSIHFGTEGSLCLQWLTQSNTCHTPHSIPGKETITSKLSSKELRRHDPSLQFTCGVHEENTIRNSVPYCRFFPLSSHLYSSVVHATEMLPNLRENLQRRRAAHKLSCRNVKNKAGSIWAQYTVTILSS